MYTMETNHTEKNNPDPITKRDTIQLLIKIFVMILFVTLLFSFVFGFFRVSDGQMSPAFLDGDLLFFYRLDKDYADGDAVLLNRNGSVSVRRVIALPGETVDITDSGVLVNGSVRMETNIADKTVQYTEGIRFPITVPSGEVFVLSDRRDNGEDSRAYGTVKISDTLGTVTGLFRRRGF